MKRRWTRRFCAASVSSCSSRFPTRRSAPRSGAAVSPRPCRPTGWTRPAGAVATPGGNIRNIALNAAFLAADVGEPVRMTHLLAAARSEYAKLERQISPSEVTGWVDRDASTNDMAMSAGPSAALLAEGLADFAGCHHGATIVVCGCGPSLNDIPAGPPASASASMMSAAISTPTTSSWSTRLATPPRPPAPSTESRALAFSPSTPELRPERAQLVPIALGAYGGPTSTTRRAALHAELALRRALPRGPDGGSPHRADRCRFHRRPFLRRERARIRWPGLRQIDAEYARLREACPARGVEVVNLSPVSRLSAFPRMPLATFLQLPAPRVRPSDGRRIVSYATTPIAGVPAILARCIAASDDAPAALHLGDQQLRQRRRVRRRS